MGGMIPPVLPQGIHNIMMPPLNQAVPPPPKGVPGFPPVPPGTPPPPPVAEDLMVPAEVGLKLEKWIGHPNIAEDIDDETLAKISNRVFTGYKLDEESRKDWSDKMKPAMDLALQVMERKNTPWPNAANVKYPLLTVAALQFNARAGAVVIQAKRVVRGEVIGRDKDGLKGARADRVASFLNWQLLEQMEEWEEDMDNLLICLPILGSAFKKTHPDPIEKRPRSDYVSAFDLVVNYGARCLEDAARITQEIELYPWEVEERVRKGLFLDLDYGTAAGEKENTLGDEDAPFQFIEQHFRYDLDEDGYPEPYVAWGHKGTQKIARIIARYTPEDVFLTWGGKANRDMEKSLAEAQAIGVLGKAKITRIQPINYFTKYTFVPSPDGGFYGLGFGALILPINETVNTTINQLLDAGTLANIQGGFIDKKAKIKKGELRFKMGEFTEVDSGIQSVKDSVYPFTFSGPNTTLMSLLEYLVSAGEKISSIQDIMLGDLPQGDTPATTTLAAIEQATKLFTGIFKRIHRSLKQESAKILRLDRDMVDPLLYLDVLNDPQANIADLDLSDHDIKPVSDPSIVSDSQKALKAQLLIPLAADPALNKKEILTRYFDATDQPHPEKLFAPPAPMPPNPDMLKLQLEREKFQMEFALKAKETEANIIKIRADAILAIAKAEAAEAGPQLELYQKQIDQLGTILTDVQDRRRLAAQAQIEEKRLRAQASRASESGKSETPPRQSSPAAAPSLGAENESNGMGGLEAPSGNADVFSMAEGSPVRANRGTLPHTGVDILRNEQADLQRFNAEIENQPT